MGRQGCSRRLASRARPPIGRSRRPRDGAGRLRGRPRRRGRRQRRPGPVHAGADRHGHEPDDRRRDDLPQRYDHPGRHGDERRPALRWSSCGGRVQCATLTVPLDYSDPSKGTIDLYVKRRPAADQSNRIGTLLVNPGGPGIAGHVPRRPGGAGLRRDPARPVRHRQLGPERHRPVGTPSTASTTSIPTSPSIPSPTTPPRSKRSSTPPSSSTRRASSAAAGCCRTCRRRTPPATWTPSAPPWVRTRSPTSASPTAASSAPPTPRCSPPTCGRWWWTAPRISTPATRTAPSRTSSG